MLILGIFSIYFDVIICHMRNLGKVLSSGNSSQKRKSLLYKGLLILFDFRSKDMTKTYQENCYIMETSILNN